MGKTQLRAEKPEDVTRLFTDCANARDVDGLVALYEPDAVLAFPPGTTTTGHAAIRAVYEQMVAAAPKLEPEAPLPTVQMGDIALCSTRSKDDVGVRVQVLRRQTDGRWLRIIDRPEVRD